MHRNADDGRHLTKQRWMLRSAQRRQSALAISQDGCSWLLLGAPLDLPQRLDRHPEFDRARGTGRNPVRAVLLADSSLCRSAGLLGLCETSPLDLYCTPAVVEDLQALMAVAKRNARIYWRSLPVWSGSPVASFRLEFAPALRLRAFMASDPAPDAQRRPGSSIALIVDDLNTGGRLFYAPQLDRVGEPERQAMCQADCVIANGIHWKKTPGEPFFLPGGFWARPPGFTTPAGMPGLPEIGALLARIGAGRSLPASPSGVGARASAPGEGDHPADHPDVTFDV